MALGHRDLWSLLERSCQQQICRDLVGVLGFGGCLCPVSVGGVVLVLSAACLQITFQSIQSTLEGACNKLQCG